MNENEFWQNFSLGAELDISGKFIYNGLRAFDQLDNFIDPSDIFEVLYNLSVGIERLQKIVIILTEYDATGNIEEFNKSLISHSHQNLMERIQNNQTVNLSSIHNKFIALLTQFYKSMRYDRYSINTLSNLDKEKTAFIDFICEKLSITYSEETFNTTQNSTRIRKFLGNIVGNIVSQLYDVLQKEARRLNIYTYEVKTFSKAYYIYLLNNFDFIDTNRIKKELLIFIQNTKESNEVKEFIEDIKPLNLDIAQLPDYLESFIQELKVLEVSDEIEEEFSMLKDKKERLELLDFFATSGMRNIQKEDNT
jgi:hypothetical protein